MTSPVIRVSAATLRVPLPRPVRNGTATIAEREYALVRLESADGVVGTACALTRGADLAGIVMRHLAPAALGRDVHDPRGLARALAAVTRPFLGTDGAAARAVSLVDIAAWDLHARSADLPIAAMLGAGSVRALPTMVASGYYSESDGLGTLRDDYSRLADEGYARGKIMAGGATVRVDGERIATAAEAFGAAVGVDLNGAWPTVSAAMQLLSSVDGGHIAFLEEPFPSGRLPLLARFRQISPIAVAVGEFESLADRIHRVIAEGLIDLLRLDVTAVGGVTPWLDLAAVAAAREIPVLPHYYPELHGPLLAAIDNADCVEVVAESSGAENFAALLRAGHRVVDGRFTLSDQSGFGVSWNEDALERFTIGVAHAD